MWQPKSPLFLVKEFAKFEFYTMVKVIYMMYRLRILPPGLASLLHVIEITSLAQYYC